MSRQLCIVHANCQGEPLAALLGAHPEFARRYRVRHFVNYTREWVPPDSLAQCALFLHQWLEPAWGELGSEAMRAQLGPRARALVLPNFLFLGYWPFWDHAPGIEFSDFFLNELAARGLNKAECMHIYCDSDVRRFHDPAALVERSFAVEREKARRWDIRCLEWVHAHWRTEQLFLTVNHPAKALAFHVAQEVLAALGFAPLGPEHFAAMEEPFPDFELPIHPQVGDILGLPFAPADRAWRTFNHRRTFRQYVSCYLDCRLNNIPALTAYLRLGCPGSARDWAEDPGEAQA